MKSNIKTEEEDLDTKLRELRKKTSKNMKQMADFFGVPYRTWQDWETRKRRTPNIAIMCMLLYMDRIKLEKYCKEYQEKPFKTKRPGRATKKKGSLFPEDKEVF